MKKAIELTHLQMKGVTGGNGDNQTDLELEGRQRYCMIDGEVMMNLPCSTDEQCQQVLQDPKASCSF